ncbi:MAG TPA: alkaline phosphatase family protein [Solirubrobacteraceae bacterium]|nr:alkaline phosphatase family protein [Solirubrobacteraceae bacterium]
MHGARVSGLTRRALLARGGAAALGTALGGLGGFGGLGGLGGLDLTAAARAGTIRAPDSLPDPSRPAGTPDDTLPFDHIVIVMQENHSFDSYLGMLPLRGQPKADGFRFDAAGRPVNANPYKGGFVTVQRVPSDCTLDGSASQSWSDTHAEIDGGRMDGFAARGVDSMAYWDEPDIPFYYSMAKTFCLANRWFCSAPCQTYPNRRFLQAGTAFGLISTDTSTIFEYPPNGTIWDRLHSLGISWANYFTDLPTTGIIAPTITKYPLNIVPIVEFYLDCLAGTLPAVSMVDSGEGVVSELSGLGAALGVIPGFPDGFKPGSIDQDEENGNVSEGENFVSHVVRAVMSSPLWPRILLVWLYDEHGGNYDHVPPPAAIAPDSVPPKLGPGDPPGGYNVYGPRVPAVVVSGHSRPGGVTNVVHDHTSVLATIEAKWNVPALTYRDANASTLADFLVAGGPSFPEPPELAAPSNLLQTQAKCDPGPITYVVQPRPPAAATAPRRAGRVTVAVSRAHARVVASLHCTGETLHDVEVELERRGRVLARAHLPSLGAAHRRVTLAGDAVKPGRYTVVVKARGKTVLARTEQLR